MSDSRKQRADGRQRWSRLGKALLSAALIGILLWKVPVGEAWEGLTQLSLQAMGAIVVLSFGFVAVAAIRWKRVLSYLDMSQPLGLLTADTLVSSTYNMLLPTNIGGDVIRALRCARRLEHAHHAWSSVLYERLVGVVALATLALPGLALAPGRWRSLGWVVGAIVFFSVLALVFAPAPFRWAARVLASRAPVMASVGKGIAQDLAGPLAKPLPRIETMLWSLLYQAVGLGILIVVAVDWGLPGMTWAILGAVPLALILTLLPVSIAGLGFRESLFVVLLGQLGVESARALSLALIWLASALLLAFAGAIVMAFEGSRKQKS